MTLPTVFNVYVYSLVRSPPPDVGARVIELLLRVRDRLNGGYWGQGATAIESSSAIPIIGAADGGFDDRQLERLRDLIARGALRTLAADFDSLNFDYRCAQPDYQTLQLLFYELFSTDGTTSNMVRFSSLFTDGPEGPLLERCFQGLNAHHGFLGIVPSDAPTGSKAYQQLVAWPPSGHWLNYLSADLVAAFGSIETLRGLLAGHAIAAASGGGAFVSLPVDPREASSPIAQALNEDFTSVMAQHLPARL